MGRAGAGPGPGRAGGAAPPQPLGHRELTGDTPWDQKEKWKRLICKSTQTLLRTDRFPLSGDPSGCWFANSGLREGKSARPALVTAGSCLHFRALVSCLDIRGVLRQETHPSVPAWLLSAPLNSLFLLPTCLLHLEQTLFCPSRPLSPPRPHPSCCPPSLLSPLLLLPQLWLEGLPAFPKTSLEQPEGCEA